MVVGGSAVAIGLNRRPIVLSLGEPATAAIDGGGDLYSSLLLPSDTLGTIEVAIETLTGAMSVDRLTSIPVDSRGLQELRARKAGDETWDEFLLELLEEYDPPEWLADLETRRREGRWLPAGELERVHEQLKLRGR